MLFRLLTLTILLALSVTENLSQSITRQVYTQFINYGVQDGLSSGIINDITQDNRGFIWIATENGLNRYDGYHFVQLLHTPDDSLTIPGNTVTSLTLDDENNLWVGTTQGLCRLSLSTGDLKRFPAQVGNPASPRTNHIRKLLYTKSSNTLWVETLEGHLSSKNLTTGSWEHFSHQPVSQQYYRYHALREDSEGNIWVGGRNTPVLRFNPTVKSFHTVYAVGESEGGKRDNDLADIYQSSTNQWYVTGLDGIYTFNPSNEEFQKIHTTSTYSIDEDEHGNIWFASGYGLICYNPIDSTFKVHLNDPNNQSSIIGNHVKTVFVDRAGNIWAGTTKGLSLKSRKVALFNHYYHIPGREGTLSSNEVTSMAESLNGDIYIGTSSHGINRWSPGNNWFKHYSADRFNPCSLASNRISTLYFDSNGTLWVGLWAGVGFNEYNSNTDCFTLHTFNKESLKRDWYNAFLEDSEGNFILGFWGAYGAYYFDRATGRFLDKHFINYSKPYGRPIHSIVNDGKGYFFFLSTQPRIFRYNSQENRYSSHTHTSRAVKSVGDEVDISLPFTSVHCQHSDGNGTTLFGTDKGIIMHTKGSGFSTLVEQDMHPLSLSVSDEWNIYLLQKHSLKVFNMNGEQMSATPISVTSTGKLLKDNNGSIYIIDSTDIITIKEEHAGITVKGRHKLVDSSNQISDCIHQGNNLIVGSTGGIIYFQKDSTGTSYQEQKMIDMPVSNLFQLNDDKIMAFGPLGIYRVCNTSGKCEIVPVKASATTHFDTNIQTATVYRGDTLWIGNRSGHYQLVVSTGELISSNEPEEDRATSHLVTTLLEDSKGQLWIGTSDRGLNRVNPDGTIKHFLANDKQYSLPGNTINATLEGSNGEVWVATNMGLCYIVNNLAVPVAPTLNDRNILSLQEDKNGIIWAGTDLGLAMVDVSTGHTQLFDQSHGVPSASFSTASLQTEDGQLAFGTSGGFFTFSPNDLITSQQLIDNVRITGMSLFGEPIRYFFNPRDTITLGYKQNFFEFNFSGSDYGVAPATKFMYRLNGIDPQWVESKNNFASYTDVPPGQYLFEVQSVNEHGVASENSASLLVVIPPPFWQTLWFKALVVIIIAGSILAYLLVYISRLKAEQMNIKLEQKLLVSQMNPHFIFNSLSAIQSYMYSNDPEQAGNYLSSFSTLVRLILDNSRSEFIPIEQEVRTLKLYLSLQQLRFPDKFDYEITIDPKLKESNCKIPPMLAQPFVENSIEHGIMHKNGKGHIQILITESRNIISIVVEDNGVGIAESKKRNIASNRRYTHTSYATSITRQRLRNLSTATSARSKNRASITIENLTEQGGEGTRVTIRMPIMKLATRL